MRGHEHGFEGEQSFRPKGDRVEATPDHEMMGQAAVSGRPDVLGSHGLLGLQRAVGNAGVGALMEEERSPVHDVIGSGGNALDTDTRADMEGRFGGQDFGDVRVHTDGAAHESAKSVNAQAYTVGSNIVFQQGNYNPGSDSGKHMLAHELTHVVQQRSGPVDGTDTGGGVKVSDPGDRFEREASANADAVMSAPAQTPAAATGPAAAVQRCGDAGHSHGDGDGADVQRVVDVQREEIPEEAEPEPTAAQTYVQREAEEESEETG
ncbi:DUF4157 domain-containing protein [Phytomonospora sp. NPDC050363]|uniref:eCIS core domain-containing protein n=1 Tax=Phytomonospora sp. NPDC050363 TaxID=3155642 RepID=UPI00340745E2